jgi:Arc/MetJ-type ribon-helix-helix transcriptional regulator
MTQVSIRLSSHLIQEVDSLVAAGAVASRTEAIRRGLEELIAMHRRAQIGGLISEAYHIKPQTSEELAGIEASTVAMITSEPW